MTYRPKDATPATWEVLRPARDRFDLASLIDSFDPDLAVVTP